LKKAATNLKKSQSILSEYVTAILQGEALSKVNSNNVILKYETVEGMNTETEFNVWEAIMELVVNIYRISENQTSIDHTKEPTVKFIFENSLNSVMHGL